MLTSVIHTKHLKLVLARTENLLVLDKIYAEALDHYAFDTGHQITSPSVGLKHRALPDTDLKDNYYIYCIYHSGHMIGYLELYAALPVLDNIYITFLYITKSYKAYNYEPEVLNGLFDYLGPQGYKTARIPISLKDWKGLEFWHSYGFDTIISVDTDHVFSSENYGRIELQYLI